MRQKITSKYIANEDGFASLIIAIVLVIVLSLLTVGFAELMRHSQEQELNRHLSDQAYYAAESGINDAVRALNNGFNQQKTDCGPVTSTSDLYGKTGANYLANSTVDTSDNSVASWTCLLIDPTPDSLAYNPVGTVTPTIFIFKPASGGISQLDFYWQDADQSNTNFRPAYNGTNAFPSVVNWGSIGMLRISLTPLASLDRNSLINNVYTAFLYPSTSTSNNSESISGHTGFSSNGGDVLSGGCKQTNTPRYCHISLNGIPGSSNGYLVSLRSIYSSTNVYITGSNGAGPVNFSGAQSLVDSTGKSQNVLKRIQVRVPDHNEYPYPGFDVQSTGGICKQLDARPGSVSLNC